MIINTKLFNFHLTVSRFTSKRGRQNIRRVTESKMLKNITALTEGSYSWRRINLPLISIIYTKGGSDYSLTIRYPALAYLQIGSANLIFVNRFYCRV